VIGLQKLIAWKLLLGTYKKTAGLSANHSAVFHLVSYIKPQIFAKLYDIPVHIHT